MIQTQLLKSDKPYQIISAAGMVGIQVATLIVTEDKTAEDGRYVIDTHSHPVVNYGNKDGLKEDLKYYNGSPMEEYRYNSRLQPEGAVWNKVEIRDVRVLGLVGAHNPPVDMGRFVYMVPSIYHFFPSDGTPIWGMETSGKIFNLRVGLERAGISFNRIDLTECDGFVHIRLTIDRQESPRPFIRVIIREASEYDPQEGVISFKVDLNTQNPVDSQVAIVRCMRELDDQFIQAGEKLRFDYRQSSDPKDEWDDLLERCTEHMNSIGWKNRHGLG